MKECPYGEKCYRKNPIHFGEFSHAHLDAIYEKGNGGGDYDIPDKYSSELIHTQLKLLEKVLPKPATGKAKESSAAVPQAHRNAPSTSDTASSSSFNSHASTSSAAARDTSNLAKKQKLAERNISGLHSRRRGEGRNGKEAGACRSLQYVPHGHHGLEAHAPGAAERDPSRRYSTKAWARSRAASKSIFMVDIGWLLGHYYFAGILDKPLLVLYGDESPELLGIGKFKPQVTAIGVKMPTPFATSHTKMMLLGYADGSMRVVISTANLYEDDWHNRTQGLWISPLLPALSEDADTAAGESLTGFRQDLMLYLVEYKISQLQPWIARIRKSDFSAINVFFVGSVPGGHREGSVRGHPWGHARLGSLLAKHATPIDDRIPVVCQSSSIGSLGANVQAWIQQDFVNSLRKDSSPGGKLRQMPPFKMIYPSFNNVSGSHDGMIGGGCLPYGKNTNDKQPWLKAHLQQWKSSDRHRSRAMPHIKTYSRYNLTDQSIYWFVLTSANLSKAAWVDAIYEKGNGGGDYDIPDKYSSELIHTQLKLLEKVLPKPATGKAKESSAAVPQAHRNAPSTSDTASSSSFNSHASTSSAAARDTSNLAKKQKLAERNIRDYIPVVVEKGGMAKKLERAAPYNMFLTAITDSKPTHQEPLSVTLQEILDESLGEIESSVQINFMVDIGWLLGHYYFAGILDKPLLVLYGDESPELLGIGKFKPQVTAIGVKMPTPFATSHTKMMLLGYADGSMRVVISTANLYEDDWHNRTQGLWISPLLPALSEDADTAAGESLTGFRQDLMLYLVEYKISQLQPWIARIRKSDFSAINVFFVGSVPGGHREGSVRGHPWGHARLGSLLAKHATPIDDRIPVVCQSSSIGSLGANVQAWIQQDFVNSLRKDSSPGGKLRQMPPFKMIYPSFNNVSGSHDGMIGGGCLPSGSPQIVIARGPCHTSRLIRAII
ncbi:GL22360 [Drosophila persimilis]|uniref:GL22360 n=1 Tax=Drosophila persimilis TaxID=7234 RepID=B4HDE2_DROPE|nr:GL22360 [Drosophila persimilis]